MLELYRAAMAAPEAAMAAFVAALRAAAWGPQPDGTFVSRGSAHGEPWVELHAPHRRGVLARGVFPHSPNRADRLHLWTPAEAWARRQAERAERRAQQAAYAATRERVIQRILMGENLATMSGQKGGIVFLAGLHTSPWVGAPGVLRAVARELGVPAFATVEEAAAEARRHLMAEEM